jgi:hypothetical protein
MSKISIRCGTCGSAEVMHDAWAVWSDAQQAWMGNVFDAAYCEICETNVSLTEVPLVAAGPPPASTAPAAEADSFR